MQILTIVLKFHVEHSSMHVCVCLEALTQNAFVSFVFFYLTASNVILFLLVNLSELAGESQMKATDNKYSPL